MYSLYTYKKKQEEEQLALKMAIRRAVKRLSRSTRDRQVQRIYGKTL